jgi:TolB-like protein/Tfp pilus assembly protein PilF
MNEQASQIFRFGPFLLNSAQRLLKRHDKLIPLTPKAFETLLALVQNSGRVLEKEELLKLVWPDTFVEEATLSQNVFTLRRALGLTEEGRQYIETVPRRGYRFVGEVKKQAVESSVEAGEPQVAASVIAEEVKTITRERRARTSLAILPLVNMTGDPSVEYLCDGITDNIIKSFSNLSHLRVLARSIVFRYKGKEVDPQEVGEALGVRAVMVGRVQQLEDRFVIQAELVDVKNGWQLWSEQFNRDPSDIIKVQEEIAKNISESLRLKVTSEEQRRLSQYYTKNTKAYQLYLKGRYFWNKRNEDGYRIALEAFEQAIVIDSEYALAYAGMADAYVSLDLHGIFPSWEVMPKAWVAAQKAVEIDDMLAEAHTSLGCVNLIYKRDWEGAEREFVRAIELNPKYTFAYSWYSQFLMCMGRLEESLTMSKLALELDPLDLSVNLHMGWYHLHAREFDQAIDQLKNTLKMNPDFYLAHLLLGMAYEQQGQTDDAISEFRRARMIEDSPVLFGFLGYTYAVAGMREEALDLLAEMQERAERSYVPPYVMAMIHTGLGNKGEALDYLEEAFEKRNEWVIWLKVSPEVDSLRSQPRFQALVARLNFP